MKAEEECILQVGYDMRGIQKLIRERQLYDWVHYLPLRCRESNHKKLEACGKKVNVCFLRLKVADGRDRDEIIGYRELMNALPNSANLKIMLLAAELCSFEENLKLVALGQTFKNNGVPLVPCIERDPIKQETSLGVRRGQFLHRELPDYLFLTYSV